MTRERELLERLVKAIGETDHKWPTQELYKAYSDAENYLHPDEFNERFRAKAGQK